MKSLHRIGLIAVSGMLLSGCSLFGGHQTTAVNGNQHGEVATAEAIAEIQLDVGRENLTNGNLAAAARYLQGARMHPATRADATNALGVVYVRLGRLDVAQRYFGEALEIEPDNARFATNFARIAGDVSFARARALNAEIEAATTEVAQLSLPVQESQEQPGAGTSGRRQPQVIHIQTASGPAQALPQMEIYARRPVVQRVEREDAQDEAPDTDRAFSRAKIIEYPVRVEI